MEPLNIWSERFGSMLNFITTSTLSLNFAFGKFFSSSTPSLSEYLFSPSYNFLHCSYLLLFFAIFLVHNLQAHAPGGTFYYPRRLLKIGGIKVFNLCLCHLSYLVSGDAADLITIGNSRTLGYSRCLLKQYRSRWRFQYKVKAFVLINGYFCRDNNPLTGLGLLVELRDEKTDVYAVLSKGRPNRGRRGGLSTRNLQLYLC